MGAGEGAIHLPAPGELTADDLNESEPLRNQANYRITEADRLGIGSLKRKCQDNLAAIELLKRLESETRRPTEEEKRLLVRYVGWGGLPQAFDSWNKEWAREREQLEQLLTSEELESARATTLNAHYTAPDIIRAIYELLQGLGFDFGRILEPACGLGHFIGLMPDEMHRRSRITGVEIDGITARLARLLYPDADIRHQPFEEAKLADGYFDVAVGNIPFGDYKPYDPRFKHWNFVIHDYFFAAALEKVRPGGLVVFITSRGTLDKMDVGLRGYVSQQADLLGAIRLPNTAFKRNANTEVTTDIIILRKRQPGELLSGPAWKEIGEITNSLGETIPVNEYFVAHPEMMLGEMRLEGRMYKYADPTLVPNGRDLGEQLAEATALLPHDIFRPQRPAVTPPTFDQTFPAPDHIKPNAYALANERIGIRDGDHIHILEGLPFHRAQRIRGLIRVRDAVRRCLRAQVQSSDESEIESTRLQLNQTYDRFVAKHGPISERANTSAFRGDPDLPLLLSLEHYDEQSRRALKAAIFRERTIQTRPAITEIKNAQDALLVTLGERGYVDLDFIGSLLHRRSSEFVPDLKGTIFLNPQTNRWETEDEYLSGNVRAKLLVAEAAAVADEQFGENVEALKLVQPTDLAASEIDARLGSTWIPADDIRQFAQELLVEDGIAVSHAPQLGLWVVQGGYGVRFSVANTTEWGTDRRSALELLEDALINHISYRTNLNAMKTTLLITILGGTMAALAQPVIVQDPWAIAQLTLQLAREGDLAAIQQLAGMEELARSLGNAGLGLSLQKIQITTSGLNAFYYDGNGLYQAIQESILTPDGQTVARDEKRYRPQAALAATSEAFRAVDSDTKERRSLLRQQIQATLAAIQSAATQAEVEKLGALLSGQSAELAALDRERDAAAARVLVQAAENQNENGRQEKARGEERAASFRQASDTLRGPVISRAVAALALGVRRRRHNRDTLR
ncbi:MAG TPA: hypothetical protein P5534_05030 [Candidatus Paceibacterota bacterium]|nr:hypothetical protein [Candidatus Paceibacterota bacterium]HRZ55867.1 hypothetical protein [Candidatus Paceibacterota bacterium]